MKMDWKAAMLAATMMVGGSSAASAQDAGYYGASPVSYNAIASDCGDAALCGDDILACGDACSCGSGFSLFGCCDHGDPWTLFGENNCGVTIGGWLSGGYYGNFRGVYTNNGNAPVPFRQISNAATLNQAWLYAEKVADADTYCFDLGYRVDAMFGTDGPETQAFGYGARHRWDNGWDSAVTAQGEQLYGTAIPQAYITAAWGDWEVKAGRFYTIIGYEAIAAPDNFFTSYAYTKGYGEPITHGGILASYNGIENTTVWGGYTNGWDTAFDNWEGQATFLGGVSRNLSDRTTFTWAVNAGDWGKTNLGGGVIRNNGNIYMNSFVLTHDLGCGWSYVFQHDLGVQMNQPGGATNNYWYGVNQYLFKEINDCWSAGIRTEWFCDEDGARVGFGPGSYYATTVGLNWKPTANLVVRPEVRFEKFDGIYGNTATPYATGTHDDGVFAGFDAILKF